MAALWPVVERHDGPDFRLFVIGGAVVSSQITGRMTSDSGTNVSATALVLVLFLFLLFRRISGILFPMAVVAAAMISDLGLMVWLDIPFSLVLSMLPIFILCVGVCYAVHVLVLVYQRLAAGSGREEAVAYAFGHSGLAILMTSLTTAAGLISFLTAELAPVRNLGIIAPCGVFFAFFFTMTLLPALIGIFPLGAQPRVGAPPDRNWSQRLLVWIGDLAVRRTRVILGAALVLVAVVGTGLFRVHFAHEPLEWLPADDPVRIASEVINRELRGATTAEVLIDTGRENGLQDPETLSRIEAGHPPRRVDRPGSALRRQGDLSRRHRQGDPPGAQRQRLRLLPDSRGSGRWSPRSCCCSRTAAATTSSSFTDSPVPPRARDAAHAVRGCRALRRLPGGDRDDVRGILGDETPITVTGRSALAARTFSALIESMARSYVFALAVITPLMMLLIGNVRIGLISMVPNLLPVFFTLAVMGLLDIPLDASSMMVGSIIIGLAVDDTIHFMHRFRFEFRLSGDTREAVRATLTTTGSAIFFTSLVLTTGFSVMGALGTLKNTVYFGYLCAFGIAVAFFANAFLTPALITLVTRRVTRGTEPR